MGSPKNVPVRLRDMGFGQSRCLLRKSLGVAEMVEARRLRGREGSQAPRREHSGVCNQLPGEGEMSCPLPLRLKFQA